jgi:hypothetical protein
MGSFKNRNRLQKLNRCEQEIKLKRGKYRREQEETTTESRKKLQRKVHVEEL